MDLKSMDPQLSNAVSYAFFQVLDAKIHHIEWKGFLATFGNTFWGQIITIFIPTNHFRLMNVDLEVNKCWPEIQNFERTIESTQISIHSFWNGLELEKSQIYMQKHQKVGGSIISGYPAWLSTSYIAPKYDQRGRSPWI